MSHPGEVALRTCILMYYITAACPKTNQVFYWSEGNSWRPDTSLARVFQSLTAALWLLEGSKRKIPQKQRKRKKNSLWKVATPTAVTT